MPSLVIIIGKDNFIGNIRNNVSIKAKSTCVVWEYIRVKLLKYYCVFNTFTYNNRHTLGMPIIVLKVIKKAKHVWNSFNSVFKGSIDRGIVVSKKSPINKANIFTIRCLYWNTIEVLIGYTIPVSWKMF